MRILLLLMVFVTTGNLCAQTIRTDGATIHIGSTTTVLTSGGISIQGSGSIRNAGSVYLGGDWINNGQGLVGSLPGTVDFNGSQSQFIGGNNVTNFSFLRISNPAAVNLSNNANVNQTLIFNSGKVNTGPYEMRMSNPPANPILGADVNKYVNGNLRVAFNVSGQSQYKYEIGSNVYAPLELTFNNVSTGGTLVASTTNGPSSLENFPTTGASGINPSARVNRHWSLSQSGLAYTAYDAGFDYSYTSFSGTPANYQIRRYTPQAGWSTEASTSNGGTSLGVTGDGIFVIGELSNTSLMESPYPALQLSPNPAGSYVMVSGLSALGEDVHLAIVDLLGKEVWSSLLVGTETFELPLTEIGLRPSCYVLMATGTNRSYATRLIIQND